MTYEERLALRDAARAVTLRRAGPRGDCWELQTSNSFRRIGTRGYGDGDVLCATTHPHDRHPDLLAAPGVLDYIVAAQPDVVIALLDDLDSAESRLQQEKSIVASISVIQTRLDAIRDALGTAVEKLSTTDGISLTEGRDVLATFLTALAEVSR